VDRDLLLSRYKPRWLGSRLECHGILPSTNDRARQLLDELGPEAHGAVVFAEGQSAGRGRFGSAWASPAGLSISMSAALWANPPRDTLPLLTLAGSLAVASALSESAAVEAGLKWPNDVVCRGRKIAGVLLEGRWSGESLEGLVLGIGVNLRQKKSDFPQELRDGATSVLIERGSAAKDEAFAASLLAGLEPLLARGLEDPAALLRPAAARWVHVPGEPLCATFGGREIRGAFAGVSEDGELILESREGRVTLRYGEAHGVRDRPRAARARGTVKA